MFDKILIANRGEIAVRIIRACREMGIKTVAVFSEPDREALHTQLADEAVCIGSAKVHDSYLNMNNIICAAVEKKVQAIHPGFGFLSENSTFAAMCEECNIKFIGPSAQVIDALGNKSNARDMMVKAGVPVIPGSDGVIEDTGKAHEVAKKLGYPVMVKASAGGGGKGIRIVRSEEELEEAFESARSETIKAFGDDKMYMEKLVEKARHVEVQVLGDSHGNVIHLGERDCSLQRKNQKVLEEAPCPVLPENVREKMCNSAVLAAKAAGYQSAGTIEFLYDEASQEYYFMEMNTRIQVEHPITEMVTGVDIVKEQINIADGKKLSFSQKDIKPKGHAIECRINAEIPEMNFMPSPGVVEHMHLPAGNGVRVDTGLYAGYKIPSEYDSMIAKVIVHGPNREAAIQKMRSALDEMLIMGVKTNLDFQYQIMRHPLFVEGRADTGFIEKMMKIKGN